MREKKDRSLRAEPFDSYQIHTSDIQVASHAHEPYIIAFRYSGDNVTARVLGTLTGFFEIDVHDEDAAYIVNFLASVAKKEYFANPRRGPVESFEAALHKINVALAELVKHGNVSWLGHLHGALTLISGNMIHFSVTGDGAMHLFRDDVLRSISEGLVETTSEPHPIKTFVEIASGSLFPGDRVLLCSPTLWNLFTPDDIERHARRLSREALEQFLRTALVNELDCASVVLITCESQVKAVAPQVSTAAPAHAKTKELLENVFSEQPFRHSTQIVPPAREASPDPQHPPQDFIDSKTGHIYVHGEELATPENQSIWNTRWALIREKGTSLIYLLQEKAVKNFRRFRKQTFFLSKSVSQFSGSLGRTTLRRLRVFWRRFIQWNKEHRIKKKAPEVISLPNQAAISKATEAISIPVYQQFLRKNWKESLTISVEWLLEKSSQFIPRIVHKTQHLNDTWKNLSLVSKRVIIGVMVLSLALLGALLFPREIPPSTSLAPTDSETVQTSTETVIPELALPADEKGAVLLDSGTLTYTEEADVIIGLVILDNVPYAITPKAIIQLGNRERVSAPEELQYATAMDDLDALFLITKSGKLYQYTPINQRFTENTLPLPQETHIDAIGAYLTYLYVLDSTRTELYRLPRIEGGFGTPVAWFKEIIPANSSSLFAVSDVVILGQSNTLQSFSKGTLAINGFETTLHDISLISVFVPKISDQIYALDSSMRRVVVWNKNGSLERQLFSIDFDTANFITVSDDQKTLYVARERHVYQLSIPEATPF